MVRNNPTDEAITEARIQGSKFGWRECTLAVPARVSPGLVLDHAPSGTGGSKSQAVNRLATRRSGMSANPGPTALRTALRPGKLDNFINSTGDLAGASLPMLTLFESRASSDIDLLMLVVGVRAPIDVIEIWTEELG